MIQNKIAFFPGVFETVYKGQLEFVKQARKQFGFDKIVFVTHNREPHKNLDSLASAQARFNNINNAIKPYKYLDSYVIEFDTSKRIHLYHLVKHLKQTFNLDKINLLIGADRLGRRYYKWDKVLDMSNLYVLPNNTLSTLDHFANNHWGKQGNIQLIEKNVLKVYLSHLKSKLLGFMSRPTLQKIISQARKDDYLQKTGQAREITDKFISLENKLVKKDREVIPVKRVYIRDPHTL